MRWKKGRRSENVDDRRGGKVPKRAAALGGGGILVVIVAMLFGLDPSALLRSGGQPAAASETTVQSSAAENELKEFVSVVLGYTEDIWNDLFAKAGKKYQEPTLVLFRDAVESACGYQQAATGPFYCPADSSLYLDLGFMQELQRRLGAQGDFAQAYIIAHEVGHHVQNLLGVSDRVHRMRGRVSEEEYNDLSVRLELQADFYAGVWAHHAEKAKRILERGDIEEAMRAAAAVGDDRIQKQAGRRVRPESFTHGTSEQRMRWFRLGLETGDLSRGDTFKARRL